MLHKLTYSLRTVYVHATQRLTPYPSPQVVDFGLTGTEQDSHGITFVRKHVAGKVTMDSGMSPVALIL